LEQNRVVPAPDGYPGAVEVSGCGRPGTGHELVIVDPESRNPCPDDQIGEVWVRGPSVTQGYWNRPAETERTFGARFSCGDGKPFLRTGDLGFLHDGQLYITGRLKDLVIIRGRNLYPHDIELTVGQSHPALSPEWGATFTVTVDGEDRLVVVHELVRNHRRGANLNEVIGSIRQRVVNSHDLSIHTLVLVRPGGIPRTTNGKIRRTACRDLFCSGGLDSLVIAQVHAGTSSAESRLPKLPPAGPLSGAARCALTAPGNEEIVDWLIDWIGRNLGVSQAVIDPDQPFASLGMDSLNGVRMGSHLQDWIGRPLPSTLTWNYPTIRSLAHYLATEDQSPAGAIQGSGPDDGVAGQRCADPAGVDEGTHVGRESQFFLEQTAE
jgi:acyl carrier protein